MLALHWHLHVHHSLQPGNAACGSTCYLCTLCSRLTTVLPCDCTAGNSTSSMASCACTSSWQTLCLLYNQAEAHAWTTTSLTKKPLHPSCCQPVACFAGKSTCAYTSSLQPPYLSPHQTGELAWTPTSRQPQTLLPGWHHYTATTTDLYQDLPDLTDLIGCQDLPDLIDLRR